MNCRSSLFNIGQLLQMLSYRRPSGSDTERAFIARYISPLPGATVDAFHNIHVTVGDSPVLWSCHTDTVHRFGGYQTLAYDAQGGTIRLSRKARKRGSNCLGADDTVGVALMVQMIHANVPGHYVFHHAEEIGGVGSNDLAEYGPELLAGATMAIAFDRRGTSDVITHQSYGRCCSEVFADSLADALNVSGMTYKPCSRGIFTDTANYTDLIGECTNLSVGYSHEHSDDEEIDVVHVCRLFDAVCAMDQSALVVNRKPAEIDPDDFRIRWSKQSQPTVKTISTITYPSEVHAKQDRRPWERDHPPAEEDLPWKERSVTMLHCFYCGESFVHLGSGDAYYCSPECEIEDSHDLQGLLKDETYLDRVYADVARALRRTH